MIRRILAKLRRRKAKPVQPLGRFFHQAVADFNSGRKLYVNDSSIAEGREGAIGLPVARKGEACTDVTISVTPDSSTGSRNQVRPAVT